MPARDTIDWPAFLEELADRADAIALQYFRSTTLVVEMKSDASPVTDADRAIEAMARRSVSERHPELGVFGEEEGEQPGETGDRLIIDPIDATRNFARGIPIFATLLAVEVDGEIVAGVVSAPALGTRWRGARGMGAFVGTRRLRVSTISQLGSAQLLHGDLGGMAEAEPPGGLLRLVRRVERSRGFGDFYQHVLVAEGAAEVGIDPVVKPWDIAPLQVIVEEAGGRATALDGERTIYGGSLLTSNGLVHEECMRALAE